MLHITDDRSALLKYYEIVEDYDRALLLDAAAKDSHFSTPKEAHAAFLGLVQWFACHLHPTSSKAPIVMLRGSVAHMYDLMVKQGEYDGFCKRYFGAVIRRHDVNTEVLHELNNMDAVPFMLSRISSAFQEDCVEALQSWVADRREPQILFYSSTDQPLTETCYVYPHEKGRFKSTA